MRWPRLPTVHRCTGASDFREDCSRLKQRRAQASERRQGLAVRLSSSTVGAVAECFPLGLPRVPTGGYAGASDRARQETSSEFLSPRSAVRTPFTGGEMNRARGEEFHHDDDEPAGLLVRARGGGCVADREDVRVRVRSAVRPHQWRVWVRVGRQLCVPRTALEEMLGGSITWPIEQQAIGGDSTEQVADLIPAKRHAKPKSTRSERAPQLFPL